MMSFNPKSKSDIIKCVLKEQSKEWIPRKEVAQAYASANFALIKYWGKESEELMIPKTNSLSVSLAKEFGTTTKIDVNTNRDRFILNKVEISSESSEFKKLFNFIDLFRYKELPLKIISNNDLSTASGLATSASGFASIVLALNKLFEWNLTKEKLSILARLGSVSASRSIYSKGFVELVKNNNTPYSFSKQLNYTWEGLSVGILQFNTLKKDVSSSKGMKITARNSILYREGWEKQVKYDLKNIHIALQEQNWSLFQDTVQTNALAMHATAISAGVIYWSYDTFKTIKEVFKLQKKGVHICFTEDAGEHIKLFSDDKKIIEKYFPDARIVELF